MSQGNAQHGARAEKLAGALTLTFSEDGTPLAWTMNGDHLFAEAAADGTLTQVHEDGTLERLPPNPDAEFGGVSGRDALRARQQVRAAVRVHARRVSAAGSPAVVCRMPAPRAAARRPGAKRTSTRAGPSSDDEPGEPPGLALAGREEHKAGGLTFGAYQRATRGLLTAPERLCVFSALPERVQAQAWDRLAREVREARP